MEKHNELIVGLDVGSNSVGWAVVEMDGDRLKEIHGMGSRIIPASDDTKNFQQGKAQAKNAERRRKRSMRRNHHRYKLRRANLVKVLECINALPEGLGQTARPGQRMMTAIELYGLRAKAVTEPITLDELGRVLYHMNQRRGYKDIGELMDEVQGKEVDSTEKEKRTSVEVERVLIKEVVLEDAKGKKEIYRVTLADGRQGTTTHKSFLQLVGKEEYVEVKTKVTKQGPSISFNRTQASDWLKDRDALDRKIEASGLHPGQFFHAEFKADPLTRIRERIVLRERYKAEFDAIWARQAEAHPELRDPALRDRVLEVLIPRNLVLRKHWAAKDLGTIVRDFVIYFQRPLKGQASNKGQCRFERKPVMPVSSPLYQLYRIWQQVNNIKLRDKYTKEHELTAEERATLVDHLIAHAELKPDQVLKKLKRDKEELETNLRGALPGHVTLGKLRKALKDEPVWDQLLLDAGQVRGMENTLLFKLWHVLYSVPEHEYRQGAVQKLLGVSPEKADAVAQIRFERKHGAVSSRAAARILPLMVCDKSWSADLISAKDRRRIQKLIDGEDIPDMLPEMRAKLTHLTQLAHFQGLPYWMSTTVVYGDHRTVAGKQLDTPDEIKPEPRGFLRNPVVEQVVNETMMVVRDIWKGLLKGRRPTSIRVELARELRQNQDQRARTFSKNQTLEKERKQLAEVLINEFGRPKPSRKDIDKYRLWEQQRHLCMYCGQGIQSTDLFNTREADIDHIIPRSLFYDDSLANKVIVHRRCNAGREGKDNLLAAPYMKSKGQSAYEDYVARINMLELPWGKRKYLLAEEVPENFIKRQLNETRYIGTAVRERLERVAPVNTTVGTVTDALKHEWGLDRAFKEVLLPRFERLERITGRSLIEEIPLKNGAGHKDWRMEGYDKRIDHRHHALDALVVALTRQAYIQKLTGLRQLNLNEADEARVKRPTWWPLPHPQLREMVKVQLERTIPSIKNRQRLLTRAANSTAYLKDPTTGAKATKRQRVGRLYAVRGPLHNEQPMGEVRMQERWPMKMVLARLAELMGPEGALHVVRPIDKTDPAYPTRMLAHEHERALLHAHLSKYDGSLERMRKALKKDPILNANGEEVTEMTMLVPRYTATKSLGPQFTASMVKGVIDRGVRKRLEEHLARFGNDPKKAFEGDALNLLNDGTGPRITKVRYVVDDVIVGQAKGRIPQRRKNDPNQKLHVEKGENHALAVFVNTTTGEREFEVVPFYDAVARKLNGLELVEPRNGFKHFLLRKGDLVYVPRPGEDPSGIDWKDPSTIAERIYRVVKFSGNRFYFLPATVSTPVSKDTGISEFYSPGCVEFVDTDEPERTKIAPVCIPITIDRLGRVTPLLE